MTICVTGPESTGKTTLANSLSRHFRGELVPEYAREYLEGLDRKYRFEDLAIIARGQIELQLAAMETINTFVFLDTSLLTIKIWGLDKFGKYPSFLDKQMEKEKIDLYLLCQSDLPWQSDALREDEKRRDQIFESYQQHLETMDCCWVAISGTGDQRLQNAVREIDKLKRSVLE